jgi:hypothetical protein
MDPFYNAKDAIRVMSTNENFGCEFLSEMIM